MKKIWYSAAGIVFAFLILSISMVRYSRQNLSENSFEYEVSVSTDSASLDNYHLPYPGILPDHPLYVLKMVRDRAKLIIVTDEIREAELLLFYADKRIGTAEALLRESKLNLAEATAQKAEQYMAKAMEVMRSLDEEKKKENIDLWWKYYHSINSHKSLLEEMLLMLEGDSRVTFEQVLRNCEVKRNEIMGELELEENSLEELIDDEVFDEEEGYL